MSQQGRRRGPRAGPRGSLTILETRQVPVGRAGRRKLCAFRTWKWEGFPGRQWPDCNLEVKSDKEQSSPLDDPPREGRLRAE